MKQFGLTHERRIAPLPDGFTVTDRLVGGTEEAELAFQLAPDLESRIEGDIVHIRRGYEALLRLQFPSPAIAIARGGDSPGPGGWVALRFGDKRAADRIVWRGNVGPAGVITNIRAVAPGSA